jgi:hypothetical protein
LSKSEKLVEVCRASGEIEAQVIKGLLESHGIPCFLKSSVGPSPFGFTMADVKVIVWDSMADSARALIESDNHV